MVRERFNLLVALLRLHSLGGDTLFRRDVRAILLRWTLLLLTYAQIDFFVTHMSQEGNRVTDCLASMSLNIVAPTW